MFFFFYWVWFKIETKVTISSGQSYHELTEISSKQNNWVAGVKLSAGKHMQEKQENAKCQL